MASINQGLIGIDITDLHTLEKKLQRLYPELADKGVERANEYILDVVRRYARPAYPNEPFFWSSEKQRRAYFASDGFGHGIPYSRTGLLGAGWDLLGYGRNQIIVNYVPYAKWVKQIETQIIGMKFRDWDVTEQDIKPRLSWISRRFNEGVRDAIKDLGLD